MFVWSFWGHTQLNSALKQCSFSTSVYSLKTAKTDSYQTALMEGEYRESLRVYKIDFPPTNHGLVLEKNPLKYVMYLNKYLSGEKSLY